MKSSNTRKSFTEQKMEDEYCSQQSQIKLIDRVFSQKPNVEVAVLYKENNGGINQCSQKVQNGPNRKCAVEDEVSARQEAIRTNLQAPVSAVQYNDNKRNDKILYNDNELGFMQEIVSDVGGLAVTILEESAAVIKSAKEQKVLIDICQQQPETELTPNKTSSKKAKGNAEERRVLQTEKDDDDADALLQELDELGVPASESPPKISYLDGIQCQRPKTRRGPLKRPKTRRGPIKSSDSDKIDQSSRTETTETKLQIKRGQEGGARRFNNSTKKPITYDQEELRLMEQILNNTGDLGNGHDANNTATKNQVIYEDMKLMQSTLNDDPPDVHGESTMAEKPTARKYNDETPNSSTRHDDDSASTNDGQVAYDDCDSKLMQGVSSDVSAVADEAQQVLPQYDEEELRMMTVILQTNSFRH